MIWVGLLLLRRRGGSSVSGRLRRTGLIARVGSFYSATTLGLIPVLNHKIHSVAWSSLRKQPRSFTSLKHLPQSLSTD